MLGFGALIFPDMREKRTCFDEFTYPRQIDRPKYHFNLKLAHYKLSPEDSREAFETNKENMSKIFSEIIERTDRLYH